MATTISVGVLVVIMVAAVGLHRIDAKVEVVGDALGWMTPSTQNGNTTYSNWAATENFTVGDILVFNFATGSHTVARVTKRAYDNCNATNPITLITNGPANYTLIEVGEHYFFCTFVGHCSSGQKLAINVTSEYPSPPPPPGSAGNPSPPPPPGSAGNPSPPGSVTAPPPPKSSAMSLGASTFFAVFMSIAIWFLC